MTLVNCQDSFMFCKEIKAVRELIMAGQTLDCKGMVCPMPIVKITQKTKEMSTGQTLEVLADDRAFEPDIKAWCNRTGNALESLAESGGVFTALVTLK